jgi:CcmD family protein
MTSGLEAVALAIGLSFVGIFAYLLYLHVLQRKIRSEIESLEEALGAVGRE